MSRVPARLLKGCLQRARVDALTPLVHDKCAGSAQRLRPVRAGERPAQRHESAVHDRVAGQVLDVPDEGHRPLHTAQRQWQHQSTGAGQLGQPGRGKVTSTGGENYAVVGRARRPPGDAVGMDDLYRRPAGPIKIGSRLPRDLLIDVDANHVTAGPGQVGEQRSVVPGAGANLEYPITGLNGKLLEHRGHD